MKSSIITLHLLSSKTLPFTCYRTLPAVPQSLHSFPTAVTRLTDRWKFPTWRVRLHSILLGRSPETRVQLVPATSRTNPRLPGISRGARGRSMAARRSAHRLDHRSLRPDLSTPLCVSPLPRPGTPPRATADGDRSPPPGAAGNSLQRCHATHFPAAEETGWERHWSRQ